MQLLFIDTSAFYAIADSSDQRHQAASLFSDYAVGKYRFVTTNYILDELYTLLLAHIGYHIAVTYQREIDKLITAEILQVIWIDEAIAYQAWQIFEKFNLDKEWSFTDCTSYVVMKQRGVTEAFTLDHHFSQMGFIQYP
ncbi:MAG: PIN domain-containing protein [Woronichinia naegeliana WA131]|jgi:predicted nucleic acid-binding protein|uniref:Ribonuclease VapC n=1 Tax=Woronichinia naegeliana WA131 TaxID=2824559 RepID=A0A977PYA5_9CYAN|nr:MAG: PIN domain-containing protein [Woronichinia naegeliana WA131]